VVKALPDEQYDIIWLENGSLRQVRRAGKVLAKHFAARKQRELDSGASGGTAIPFGDTVLDKDPSTGGFWIELLGNGAKAVSMNPQCESTRKALNTIAVAARVAPQFIQPADMADREWSPVELIDYMCSQGAIGELVDQAGELARQKLLNAIGGKK
jgi:hypothetical protein